MIDEGLCRCPLENQKINEDGYCGDCNIKGCASCKATNPNVCIKCQDCSASLVDGECICMFADAIWNDFDLCTTDPEDPDLDTDNLTQITSSSVEKQCSEKC